MEDDTNKIAARKGLSVLRRLWEQRSFVNQFHLSMYVDDTRETVSEISLRFVQHSQNRRQLRRKKT